MQQVLQAAALVAQLPAQIATALSCNLQSTQINQMASLMGDVASLPSRARRAALLAFALQLQGRCGSSPSALNRRGVAAFCLEHLEEARLLLADWLHVPQSNDPVTTAAPPARLKAVAGLVLALTPRAGQIVLRSLQNRLDLGLFERLTKLLGELDLSPRNAERIAQRCPLNIHNLFVRLRRPLPTGGPGKPTQRKRRSIFLCHCCQEVFVDGPSLEEHLEVSHYEMLHGEALELAQALAEWLARAPLPTQQPEYVTELRVADQAGLDTLSDRQKAAVLLMCLPPEVSAQLFKKLGPEEVREITQEISKMPQTTAEFREQIRQHFLRQIPGAQSLEQAAVSLSHEFFLQLRQLLSGPPAPQVVRLEDHHFKSRAALRAALPGGFYVVFSDALKSYFNRDEVKLALRNRRAELSAAWARELPPLIAVHSEGMADDLAFFWKNHELLRKTLPSRNPETLLRCLDQALVMQSSLSEGEPLKERQAGQALSSDGQAAIAAIRAFPANALEHELVQLKSPDLLRVAGGIIEFLTMPEEVLKDHLRESVNFTPGELLHQAGLLPDRANWGAFQTVAVVLTLMPLAVPSILKEMVQLLTRANILRLTEKLIRLLYRKEERPLTQPEELSAVGHFAEWHATAMRRPGHVRPRDLASVLAQIPLVWPCLSTASAQQGLVEMAQRQPAQMAELLARFLRQASSPWVPGPIRASHFINSLGNPPEIRERLALRGYPVPAVAVDLGQIRISRGEWASRGSTSMSAN